MSGSSESKNTTTTPAAPAAAAAATAEENGAVSATPTPPNSPRSDADTKPKSESKADKEDEVPESESEHDDVDAMAALTAAANADPKSEANKVKGQKEEESDGTESYGANFRDFSYFDGKLIVPTEVPEDEKGDLTEFTEAIETDAIDRMLELVDFDRKIEGEPIESIFGKSLAQLVLMANELNEYHGEFDNVSRVFIRLVRDLFSRVLLRKHNVEMIPPPLKLYKILEDEYELDMGDHITRAEKQARQHLDEKTVNITEKRKREVAQDAKAVAEEAKPAKRPRLADGGDVEENIKSTTRSRRVHSEDSQSDSDGDCSMKRRPASGPLADQVRKVLAIEAAK